MELILHPAIAFFQLSLSFILLGISKIKTHIDWVAMVSGVAGSFLVATSSEKIRLLGFILFLTGNILWMIFSFRDKKLRAIFVLNAFYFLSSALGIYSNIFWIF
jgi:nicotinamide riboside transporter PnuC